jgi:hypothetical protein
MIKECVVVGNSPRIKSMGNIIDSYTCVIRTGCPILTNDTGYKTDMLITRGPSLHEIDKSITSPLNEISIITESQRKKYPSDIVFLTSYKINCIANILSDCDTHLRFNDSEKPTLGIIALMFAATLKIPINVVGIETDYNSEYLSKGHYGDINHIRDNRHHSMIKELLWLNKQIKNNTINLLNNTDSNK